MRKAQGFGSLWHLATRFFGSLLPFGPAKDAESWAISHLLPGEAALFTAMSGADRRHAIGVARRAVDLLAGSDDVPGETAGRPFVAAGLLHDVGKIRAHLGTLGRVGATVMAVAFGREKVVAWAGSDTAPGMRAAPVGETTRSRSLGRDGGRRQRPSPLSVRGWQARMGRYLMHDVVGAALLEDAGSDVLTSTWAREHHLPESRWSVEARLGQALKEADGD